MGLWALLFSRKGDSAMGTFISQLGLATASFYYTNDFSPILVGLVGVIWLSSGLIVWATIQHYLYPSWKLETGGTSPSIVEDLRDAA
jgi:hypothetical protein